LIHFYKRSISCTLYICKHQVMSTNGSYVVVGSRKNLPQIFVGAGDISEDGSLRYRTSDSSVGSSARGSDSGCGTPAEADVADVLVSPQFRNRYGTPTTYTMSSEAVFDQEPSSQSPWKKTEESINMDSGINLNDTYSPKSKNLRRKSTSDLWETVIMSPVVNLTKKLKKRPSFVDEGNNWNPDTEAVLTWIIFSLIVVSFLMAGIVTYAALRDPSLQLRHNNGKYDSMKFAAEKQMRYAEETEEEIQYPAVDKDFLLKEDVTMEEVIEYKRVLEDDFGESKIIETDYIYQDLYRHEGVDYIMEEEEIVLIEEDKTMEAYLSRIEDERDSKEMLEKAEKLLEEETKLLAEVSKKLKQIVSTSDSESLTNEIDQDAFDVDDDDYSDIYMNAENEDVVDGLNGIGTRNVTVGQTEKGAKDNSTSMKQINHPVTKGSKAKAASKKGNRKKVIKSKNENPLFKSISSSKMSKVKSNKTMTSDKVSVSPKERLKQDSTNETNFEMGESEVNIQIEDDIINDDDDDYIDEEYDEESSRNERVKRARWPKHYDKSRLVRFRKYKNTPTSRDEINDFYLRNNEVGSKGSRMKSNGYDNDSDK